MLYSLHAEVLLSVESSILAVDNPESIDQHLSCGPFTHIAASRMASLLRVDAFKSHQCRPEWLYRATHGPDP